MTILLLLLLRGSALAEEPQIRREEITVYGEPLVERAREQLIRDLKEQGYSEELDRGDYILLRHVEPWKGEVRIYDDGWVRMKRQAIRVESRDLPWAKKGSPVAWASCLVYPLMCVKTGGVLVSRRKWTAVQVRTLGEIDPEADVLADRVADAATERQVNDLPPRLEGLWLRGEPLQLGAPPALTMEERKAALLAFWDSRTDTIWGDRVRQAIEAFMRAEVETGPHAFTADEIAAFNARRSVSRALELTPRADGP